MTEDDKKDIKATTDALLKKATTDQGKIDINQLPRNEAIGLLIMKAMQQTMLP